MMGSTKWNPMIWDLSWMLRNLTDLQTLASALLIPCTGLSLRGGGQGFPPATFMGKKKKNTVKPLLTDTSITRTPLCYRQFHRSQKCQKSDISYLYNRYTSVKQTILVLVLLVSVLKRLDCRTKTEKKSLAVWSPAYLLYLSGNLK